MPLAWRYETIQDFLEIYKASDGCFKCLDPQIGDPLALIAAKVLKIITDNISRAIDMAMVKMTAKPRLAVVTLTKPRTIPMPPMRHLMLVLSI